MEETWVECSCLGPIISTNDKVFIPKLTIEVIIYDESIFGNRFVVVTLLYPDVETPYSLLNFVNFVDYGALRFLTKMTRSLSSSMPIFIEGSFLIKK